MPTTLNVRVGDRVTFRTPSGAQKDAEIVELPKILRVKTKDQCPACFGRGERKTLDDSGREVSEVCAACNGEKTVSSVQDITADQVLVNQGSPAASLGRFGNRFVR